MDETMRDWLVEKIITCDGCPDAARCGAVDSFREELETAPEKTLAWIEDNLVDWCIDAAPKARIYDIAAIEADLYAEAVELFEALKKWFDEHLAASSAPPAGEAFPSQVLKRMWERP